MTIADRHDPDATSLRFGVLCLPAVLLPPCACFLACSAGYSCRCSRWRTRPAVSHSSPTTPHSPSSIRSLPHAAAQGRVSGLCQRAIRSVLVCLSRTPTASPRPDGDRLIDTQKPTPIPPARGVAACERAAGFAGFGRAASRFGSSRFALVRPRG
jgi:hypothetical protein